VFGGRRTGKPRQAFPYALLYVLGMAATYSALGLLAAFTGSLFGSFLQNPLVLAGIGVLMIALALAPLGLYTFQPPAWLLASLGGAQGTSAVGVFLSGLVVGVFAAPCIGPPVVALLALVAAVGSPWFGFASLFTVAVGLGLPYLLLGTFSGLLQKLPRSGEWMVWVEHLLGIVLLALGGYFLALAFMPDLAEWVMPVALVLGGLYLGFLDRNGNALPHFRVFKRLAGVVAVVGAVAIGSQLTAQGLEFSPVTESELAAAVAGGQPVMIDFSADWCVPCHELENFTFTDRRVIGEARAFRTFKVDLTRYDSPEAEAWRKRYGITGVPTIVFLGPDGAEIRPARVEGFMPAQPFVERMRLAAAAWKGPRG
ncbi:MAG: thioredoxin family protein, partial [Solirubrobacteraceae bacterium]|nr:thioredoxin family protein [Solirubrobacteraceae bacterium]